MAKVSQNISSESLFHFIRQREWLLEILHNKFFQARYVYEDLPELRLKVGIPMKCFCDIPLGLIKKHLNKYGKYGLGITKSFAKENYLSPVFYVHENSDAFYRYISNIDAENYNSNLSLVPYFKVDIRTSKSAEGKNVTYRFYDEREWRFIPSGADSIEFSESDDVINRLDIENKKLEKNRSKYILPFDYTDITYIFVQHEKDVDNVIEEIRKIPTSNTQQDRLISKIITSKQIERDF